MNLWLVLLLGIIQGITEFLPVSSSGHLAILRALLPGFDDSVLIFDLIVHLGTVLALVVYFRREFAQWGRSLAGKGRGEDDDFVGSRREGIYLLALLIIGNIPTALIGLSLEDAFSGFLQKPAIVGLALLLTGTLLVVSDRRRTDDRIGSVGSISMRLVLLIGIVQGCAVIPGISRSGSTITVAILLGISRPLATRLSFFMATPAILGAFTLEIVKHRELLATSASFAGTAAIAFAASALFGFVALGWLVQLVNRGTLQRFGFYCLSLGAFAILFGLYA